jgi:hypothetical protein
MKEMIDDNFELKRYFNMTDEEYELNVSLLNKETNDMWDDKQRDIIKDILGGAEMVRKSRQTKQMFMSITEFEFYLANNIHIPFYAVVYI